MVRPRNKSNRKQHSRLIMLLLILSAAAVAGLFWKGISWFTDYTGGNDAYDKIILEASRRNQIDPRLVKAVIWRESRFNPRSVGKAGEIGLMQVMQENAATDWARAMGKPVPSKGALFNPKLNIEIGSWYLARSVRRWSKYRDCYALALCEYNAGLTRANKWKPADPNGDVRSRIAIASTHAYVNEILDRYETYKQTWEIK